MSDNDIDIYHSDKATHPYLYIYELKPIHIDQVCYKIGVSQETSEKKLTRLSNLYKQSFAQKTKSFIYVNEITESQYKAPIDKQILECLCKTDQIKRYYANIKPKYACYPSRNLPGYTEIFVINAPKTIVDIKQEIDALVIKL